MQQPIVVIIPALNEEQSIAKVIAEIPPMVHEIVVVDNNSNDNTAAAARAAGATVVTEMHRGYGAACLRGIRYCQESNPQPFVVVFIDGDFADFPAHLPDLVAPILNQQIDLVIGSRSLGQRAKNSMTFPQVFGNRLATALLKIIYGAKYTDLGPFRAIKFSSLLALGMRDRDYGWTVEMQLKAAKMKMRTCEVPVNYKARIGVSKVSGTVKGTVMAGYKILLTIFRYL